MAKYMDLVQLDLRMEISTMENSKTENDQDKARWSTTIFWE